MGCGTIIKKILLTFKLYFMTTPKKKPAINDARKEVSDALEKFIKLERKFNEDFPNKSLNIKIDDFSFFASDVETSINEWENIIITFTSNIGLKLSVELNKFDATTLQDFLLMDINELDNRESSRDDENDEDESDNDDDTEN